MSKGEIQLSILAAFRRIHGHLLVPKLFRVPARDTQWPADFANFGLGRHVRDILQQRDNPKLKYFETQDLQALRYVGFCKTGLKDYPSYTYLIGFEKYLEIYQNVNIPLDFVIPRNDRWPEVLYGVKLGVVYENICNHGDHKTIHNDLRMLGYKISSIIEEKGDELLNLHEAAKIYAITGDLNNVPLDLVIEKDSVEYPSHLWGCRLGSLIHSVKRGELYRDNVKLFRKLGLVVLKTVKDHIIVQAVAEYKGVFDNVSIPVDFEIKAGDTQFSKELWGFKVGECLQEILTKNVKKLTHSKLRALGVVVPKVPKKPKKQMFVVE